MKYIVFYLCVMVIVSCKSGQSDFPKVISDNMSLIPAGLLSMGGDNDQADQDEYPKHQVTIASFWMDVTEVTNQDFKKFVDETGYVTIAEKPLEWEILKQQLPPGTPKPPDSVLLPGALVFQPTKVAVSLNNPGLWWKWTIGANWREPEGPGSSIKHRMNHPVVQIAWDDAMAYAKWAGKRLPTEAEWEWASRGGMKNMIYPWGNENVLDGKPKANFHQGLFPYTNDKKDGYAGTAPVKSYAPNNYGLYDMAGNVWEWCLDWYKNDYYQQRKDNIAGPEKSYDPQQPYTPQRVVRGGSFLCSEEYCSGYRNARRMKSSPDTGLSHTGFRCVKDIKD